MPVLTVLAPSERYYQKLGKIQLTDWARQMIIRMRRWLPERDVVIVADSRSWTCCTFANRFVSPSSLAWTLLSMNLLPLANLEVNLEKSGVHHGQRLPTLKHLLEHLDTH